MFGIKPIFKMIVPTQVIQIVSYGIADAMEYWYLGESWDDVSFPNILVNAWKYVHGFFILWGKVGKDKENCHFF